MTFNSGEGGGGGHTPHGGKGKRGTASKRKARVPKDVAKAIRKAKRDAASTKPEDLRAAAKSVVKRFEAWQRATGTRSEVAKEAGNAVKASEAAFREAVELGLPVGGSADEQNTAIATKLRSVEVKWQDWREAQAGSAEKRKNAAKDVKAAWKSLERAIEETKQLPLFQD